MTLALKDLAGRTIARANPSYSKVAEWVVDELAFEFNADELDIDFDEENEIWTINGVGVAHLVDEVAEARELAHRFPNMAA
jgi:hypothetical protein